MIEILVLSSNDSYLAIINAFHHIILWNLYHQTTFNTFDHHIQVISLAFLGDKEVVTGIKDEQIRVFRIEYFDLKEIVVLFTSILSALVIHFRVHSNELSLYASYIDDNTIIWCIKTHLILRQFEPSLRWLEALFINPILDSVLFASNDCSLQCWNTKSGKFMSLITALRIVEVLCWGYSRCGRYAIAGGARLFDYGPRQCELEVLNSIAEDIDRISGFYIHMRHGNKVIHIYSIYRSWFVCSIENQSIR